MNISELEFSDLYLCADAPIARYRPIGGGASLALLDVPGDYLDDLGALRQAVIDTGKPEFSLVFDNVRYRVARVGDVQTAWYVLRRGFDRVPDLAELGLHARLVTMLNALGRGSGLIVIAGGTGDGKTTTASSLLREYVARYGDLAVSIEDPPELPLSGFHGAGQIFQLQVEDDDWETPLKAALRYRARYILIGEIRTPGAAFQALRAAVSGHLVITTIHASSIEQSIEAMSLLAAQRAGTAANTLIGNGLSAVLHQTLSTKLLVRSLFIGQSLGDPARAIIREGRFGQLTTIIQQQAARL